MVIQAVPAKSDLKAIHDFIAFDSKYYAKKVKINRAQSLFSDYFPR